MQNIISPLKINLSCILDMGLDLLRSATILCVKCNIISSIKINFIKKKRYREGENKVKHVSELYFTIKVLIKR